MVDKDDAAMKALKPILEQYPDLTEAEILELYEGIMQMGAIAYQKTQQGLLFVQDDPENTH